MEAGQLGKRIAIIPARGGSKRIPRKNVLPFMGKPMIAWTIEAAISCGEFDAVYVSTDDLEIADVSREHGASIPFLRESFADDQSPVSLATLDFLTKLANVEPNDIVVQLMANCPLRKGDTIVTTINNFCQDTRRLSVISGMSYGMFNPWWAHRVDERGDITPLFEAHTMGTRSQDLPKLLCPTGAIWISSFERLSKEKTFYSRGYRLFDIGWKAGVDIDDYHDLEFAQAAYQIDNKNDT